MTMELDSIARLGSAVLCDVFRGGECDRLLAALESQGLSRGRAGARHILCDPAVLAAARDERMMAVATAVLGPGAAPFRATLFAKTGKANWLVVWHQDTALPLEDKIDSPEWGPWSKKAGVDYAHAPAWALERVVALRLHLDDSTLDNGPLRIIPGSHRSGVLSDSEVFEISREGTPFPCLAGRGAVVVMRPLLIHSSSKARSDKPRRVLHIEYADALQLRPGIRLAVC